MATRRSLSAVVLIFLLSCSLPAIRAQESSEKAASQSTPEGPLLKPAKAKKESAAAKAKAEEQRALALSLLVSLSNEARAFRDQKLRARTLARIADGLWEADPDQSRTLFQKAWDAAEAADQESARLAKEDRAKQEAGGRGVVISRGPDLRSEVLRLAAKRDRALGEELLEKLKKDKAQEIADATNAAKREPFDLPETMAQRLRLARQLLDVDVPRALEFADPALAAVTMQGLSFLSTLKDKDSAAADLRYMRMLGAAAADPLADANTVSLLSSYVFTPFLFITIDGKGSTNTSQGGRPGAPQPFTPELRSAFFQTATQILMRPLAPPEQDRTTSGIEGKYLIIKRLMPLFEQFASRQTAEMLNGQLAALSANVREEARKRDDEFMRSGIRPEEEPADTETSLLDRIARAKTSAERDQLYIELIMRTMGRADERARDFVEKLEDLELRKQVRPYVDVILVINYINKKKMDEAQKLAHTGELTHFQKVWAFTQIARQLITTEDDSAVNLLAEALEEARRIDGSDADRPRALTGIANAYFALDRNRSWELVTEAVKAANSVAGFSGEDSRMILQLRTPYITSIRTNSIENFDLPAMFRSLTKDDYHRAEGLARNFEADAPRATALISVARALLSDERN